MAENFYLGVTILILSIFGIVVNVASIVILMLRKGASQMFHHLLKLLALYDLVSIYYITDNDNLTVFENHPKCLILIFELWHFPQIFVLSKLTCLVTLFDRKLQVFQNLPKWTIINFCPLIM